MNENNRDLLQKQIRAGERILANKISRDDLIRFAELTMPDIQNPSDPNKSRYNAARHHRGLAAALEELEAGRITRLIVTMPPRHGKSELISRRFPAWALGRNPYQNIIFATYGGDFAEDFGRDVRANMATPAFAQIFPEFKLRAGAASASRIQTDKGGLAVFVGRGGPITGRGADLLIIDDIIKDAEEADSPTVREKAWEWFTKTAMTRLMSVKSGVIVVMTRWHEDDLVGRLTDPNNPCYNAEEAKTWKVIDLPAYAEEDDPLGRKVGEILWPERFGHEFLESQRRLNPRGFSALYQQRPTPEDGELFKKENVHFYTPDQLPKGLRIYGVSDHAVGQKQRNDRNCFIIFGVDELDNIWLLDVFWKQAGPEEAVRAMTRLMAYHKPMMWYAERGHISKSIGPFLLKSMREQRIYNTSLQEITPVGDKVARAGSFLGRFSMNKIRFPKNAPWANNAIDELLKFPYATRDDFVDACSLIGIVVDRLYGASEKMSDPARLSPPGTIGWIKQDSIRRRREKQIEEESL